MSDHANTLHALQAWAEQARRDGWVDSATAEAVSTYQPHDPTKLFADGTTSPLVLAFFGGTGVGKSSLLNRLAGSDVAKSGVVRPTSREVTLYVHEDIELASLPEDLPVEHTRIKRHNQHAHRDTLWIDTPDIDSVVTTHRDQVLAWMPYIDLLVYVVSPERYRDDAGWDLLQQHRHRHDWAFVINHWDRGDPAQRADFTALLNAGGIDNPAVFCTDCRNGGSDTDDFGALQQHVASQSEAVALAEARRRSAATERAALQSLAGRCEAALGRTADWSEFEASARETERRFTTHCDTDTLASRERLVRQLFPDDPPPFWRRVLGKRERVAALPEVMAVWTPRCTERLTSTLDESLIAASDASLPLAPLRSALAPADLAGGQAIDNACLEALSAALSAPGNRLQRAIYRAASALTVALPLLALVLIGVRVLGGFVAGASDPAQYIGLNFVTNSLMLLALSAALPAVVAEWVRPSQRAASQAALRAGVESGCGTLFATVSKKLNALKQQRDNYLSSLNDATTTLQ